MIMTCFGGDVVDQNRLIRYFDAHASTLVVLQTIAEPASEATAAHTAQRTYQSLRFSFNIPFLSPGST
jgi:hypothetical protein